MLVSLGMPRSTSRWNDPTRTQTPVLCVLACPSSSAHQFEASPRSWLGFESRCHGKDERTSSLPLKGDAHALDPSRDRHHHPRRYRPVLGAARKKGLARVGPRGRRGKRAEPAPRSQAQAAACFSALPAGRLQQRASLHFGMKSRRTSGGVRSRAAVAPPGRVGRQPAPRVPRFHRVRVPGSPSPGLAPGGQARPELRESRERRQPRGRGRSSRRGCGRRGRPGRSIRSDIIESQEIPRRDLARTPVSRALSEPAPRRAAGMDVGLERQDLGRPTCSSSTSREVRCHQLVARPSSRYIVVAVMPR